MAFALALSKFESSSEATVAPGAVILAEGQAMVRAPGATSLGVMPSTAATATEVFVGFAIAGTSALPFPEAYTNKVITVTVPSTGIVTLPLTPVAGQIFAFDNTTGAVATFTAAGAVLSGLTAGDSVTFTFKYAMTVVQATALAGNVQPGGYAGAYVNQIGLVKRGLVFTSEFNVAANWAASTAIKLAANGQITDQTGTGATIQGAVVQLPSIEYPFLGIEFSTI